MEVPKVTLEDYKDWAQRHDIAINIPDEELQEALIRGNKIAQDQEDRREQARNKHKALPINNSGESNSVGREEEIPDEGSSDTLDTSGTGSSPVSRISKLNHG